MADDAIQVSNPKSQVSSQLSFRPGGKEMEAVGEAKTEKANIEIVADNPEIEPAPEIQGYVEKVEKEVELTKPVVDDYTGQVLLNPTQQLVKVPVLPLTEAQVVEGLHMQVYDSLRWMAEWCVRQIKLLHGRVRYKA